MWDKETTWKKAADYLLIGELDLISNLPLNSRVQAPVSPRAHSYSWAFQCSQGLRLGVLSMIPFSVFIMTYSMRSALAPILQTKKPRLRMMVTLCTSPPLWIVFVGEKKSCWLRKGVSPLFISYNLRLLLIPPSTTRSKTSYGICVTLGKLKHSPLLKHS